MENLDVVSDNLAPVPTLFKKGEQVRLIYMQAFVSNCTVIFISLLYYYVLHSRLNSNIILLWLILLLCFAFYRLHLWNSQRKEVKKKSPETWLNLYLIGCGLLGVSWSVIYPCLLSSNDPIVLSALLILAFGVMSSAIPILSASLPAFLLYTYPQGIALIGTLLCMEDVSYSWMAAAVSVYLLMITLFARNTNISIFQSIRLQHQNRTLIEELNEEIHQREVLISQRTNELKKKNDDLTVEMAVRKKAEKELRNSERKYRELIESSPDLRYRTDTHGRITFISPSVEKISGFTVDEAIGLQMADFYADPEERKTVLAVLEKNGIVTEFETQIRRKDGSTWWASTNAHFFTDNEGNVLGIEGVTRDVTARKEVEEILWETKKRLAAFMDSATDGFILLDSDFQHLEMNRTALELTGLKRQDVLGKNLVDIFPEIQESQRYKAYRKVVDTGEPYLATDVIHHPMTGETCVEIKAFKVGDGLGMIFTDITTRKQAEEEKLQLKAQLHQSQKLESIGTLAGGVAHEFNNMLAIILGNNQLIIDESSPDSQIRESAEEINYAGIRARDVVKQLLTFSRQNDAIKKVVNFRVVLEKSLKLIRSSTPVNIKIDHDFPDDICPVLANDTQINQLLINLCNNAVDALPDKEGVITIALSNETIDSPQREYPIQLDGGQYVKLTVRDNGSGMDAEILERIFEPYYTTKKIGEGTGIGLAIVHGIVERHGGAIMAESTPGRGTAYTIFFPAHDSVPKPETGQREGLPMGEERILYVDDEPSITRLSQRLLENLGYTIESTTNPGQALKMIQETPDKYDLLITDMAMPDMTGDTLICEALKIRQDLPTIICTGYSAKISEEDAVKIGACAFVMKPINKTELANIVRKVLDENQTADLVN